MPTFHWVILGFFSFRNKSHHTDADTTLVIQDHNNTFFNPTGYNKKKVDERIAASHSNVAVEKLDGWFLVRLCPQRLTRRAYALVVLVLVIVFFRSRLLMF